jgi:hypothetical protein
MNKNYFRDNGKVYVFFANNGNVLMILVKIFAKTPKVYEISHVREDGNKNFCFNPM